MIETMCCRNKKHLGNCGYTLVELMVVVLIMGILAGTALYTLSSSKQKMRYFALDMRSVFQTAKWESVNRNQQVYLDFDFDDDSAIDNGYTMWVDVNGNGAYNAVGVPPDTIIRSVVFDNKVSGARDGVEVYCNGCTTNGPQDGGEGGPGGKTIGDGISIAGKRFNFNPNGTSASATLYLYFAETSGGTKTVEAGPFAITLNSSGRVRISEWKSGSSWNPDN